MHPYRSVPVVAQVTTPRVSWWRRWWLKFACRRLGWHEYECWSRRWKQWISLPTESRVRPDAVFGRNGSLISNVSVRCIRCGGHERTDVVAYSMDAVYEIRHPLEGPGLELRWW